MSSEVYFAQRRASSQGGLLDKLEQLCDAAGFAGLAPAGALVAVVLPFGAPGNSTTLRPVFVQCLLRKLRGYGLVPFLTDTLPLPESTRSTAIEALAAAEAHGLGHAVTGAPLVVADGLRGTDAVELAVAGNHLSSAAVAAAIAQAEAVLSVRHFTAHAETGYVGALWNTAVGAASREGKRRILSPVREPALALAEPPLRGARASAALQERLVEAAAALQRAKPGRMGYVNLLLDLTPEDDDQGWSDAAVAPDIGVVAGRDPVALDQASIDLFNQAPGLPGTRLSDPATPDKLRDLYPEIDWSLQLAYAEAFGLGKRDYELMVI